MRSLHDPWSCRLPFILAATDFGGLARCFISAAGVDPLRDDGVEYVRLLIGAGVTAYCVVEPQLPHGHLRARATSHRAREAFGRILDAIREFAHLPLVDLVKKFGTDTRFSEWLKATKVIEDIAEKRIKNSKSEGDLVSRDLIKTGVIDHVEKAHMQILTDGCKTMTKRLVAMHGAGRDDMELEEEMRSTITSFIRPMKTKIAKGLREA